MEIYQNFFKDKEGLLWFGSGNGKLYKIDTRIKEQKILSTQKILRPFQVE